MKSFSFFLFTLAVASACSTANRSSLVVRNVTVIDGTGAAPKPEMTVVIDGAQIAAISPAGMTAVPRGARVIDGSGKYLMPGLWDIHQHFSEVDGALDLANGVTSARDMANDTDSFLQRIARFDDASELGPRTQSSALATGGSARKSTPPRHATPCVSGAPRPRRLETLQEPLITRKSFPVISFG